MLSSLECLRIAIVLSYAHNMSFTNEVGVLDKNPPKVTVKIQNVATERYAYALLEGPGAGKTKSDPNELPVVSLGGTQAADSLNDQVGLHLISDRVMTCGLNGYLGTVDSCPLSQE